MNVALTGATGFIGSHVLTELLEHGHEVTALVRDDTRADTVAARGATPAVVDLYDRPTVVTLLREADGAIHTASPGDATSAELDSAVVDAAIEAFEGTGRPYIQISGLWIYGSNSSISEDSPLNAPAFVAWKEPIERRVLDAKEMRGVVIVSSVAYGDGGGGIPGLLLGSPETRPGTWSCSAPDGSTGRRYTLRTWRSSSGACWRTARLAAATWSVMEQTRPWPN